MGAKFSSGSGATVFYDDGPITAPSGEQGTQRTEFEAAIKSVTSSTTVGAVFVYDTRNDSDGGAWRKKTQGLSWYDEDLNTATRGGRREFPSVALIVADNSATSNVTIYDLDDPAMPMWMVINRGAGHILFASGMGSVFALNGRLYVGHSYSPGALSEISFVDDYGFVRIDSTTAYNGATIADREVRTSDTATGTTGALVNRVVNDVAATVLEGAEIGALGLPIPTVAVATDGGVSVIHANGSVYDIRPSSTTYAYSNNVAFTENNRIVFSADASSNLNVPRLMYNQPIPYADDTTLDWGTTNAADKDFAVVAGFVPNVAISGAGISKRIVGNKFDAFASANGLSIAKRNTGNFTESLVANVTSTYNTGYMLGDIRFAGLANGGTSDRSVKGNHLTTTGSIAGVAVSTNAELVGFSGFSASNYLSDANDTDFDFGTGDFSVMFWAKFTSNDSGQCMIDRSTSGTPRILIYNTGGNVLQFYIHDGSGGSSVNAGSFGDNNWHQVVCVKRGTSSISIFVDGVFKGETTSIVSGTLSSATAPLHIGVNNAQNDPLNGSLSLVRLSATAPTPQQVKEIYEAEKPLFRAGAKCLLQSDSGSPNLVNDLSYDSTTGLLHAYQGGTNTAETRFKGLEAVDSYGAKSDGWSASGATGGVAAGGVKATYRAAATGGVIVDLPAIDVRGDINTADSKLPDDGKIHFSAAISDSNPTTPTVIGVLPIAEGETYYITARVFCKQYIDNTSAVRASYVIEQKFRRPIGGNATASTPMSVLRDEGTASMDAVFSADSSSQQIRLTVTGVANTRSIWSAELDVERISDKQYER